MRKVNLLTAEQDRSSERDGYRWRAAVVGRALGSQEIGACLYELEEGQRTWPFHFHHVEEEWLVVIAGSPTVRGANGERALREGDVVCFPAGPAGAHQVTGPGAVLMLSANAPFEVVEYPTAASSGCGRPGRSSALPMPSTTGTANERAAQPLRGCRRGRPVAAPGYGRRMLEFGESIGAARLGGSLYELDPGDSICPYHYENTEEEWLLVLVGTPTLRDPDGEHELTRGDLVCFLSGPDGAHKVTNRSAASHGS